MTVLLPVGRRHFLCVAASVLCALLLFWVDGVQAEFDVQRDAFSISNEPGYCFAMAAFSRWYYINNHSGPALRRLLNKRTQISIAKELQRFYSKNLIGLQADYCNRHHYDQSESFRRFIVGLTIGEPRIVLLMNKGKNGAVLHAVLAHEWIPDRNWLKVYDPNYPGRNRILSLDDRKYTSLDITYNEICFPEALENNRALVAKMQNLFSLYCIPRTASSPQTRALRSRR